MTSLVQDLRFALRLLLKSPSFTLVAVLTLGLGIGANSAIFSVVNAVILRPLPYKDPQQLVQLHTQFPTMKFDRFWISGPEFFDLLRDTTAYQSMGAWVSGAANLGGGERPVRATAVYASSGLLPTLGVQPALGRHYTQEEDRPGDPTVVVLGHGLWTRAFAADPNIIGRKITLDTIPVTVVGVMPRGFDFPGGGVELWAPLGLDPAKQGNRGGHYLSAVARLRPGLTLGQARAELSSVMAASVARLGEGNHPLHPEKHPVVLHAVKDELIGPVRPGLLMLQGAVAFVLLIACLNLSNLLLARAEARGREIAIRTVLGARRARLARQFLTESALLGLMGGAAGLLLAVWLIDPLVALMPEHAPRGGEIRIDTGVVLFTLASAMLASLLFGLAPIVHTRLRDLHASLKAAGLRVTDGRSRQRFRRALVASEVALAMVLVAGAGLMIRSFAHLQRVELGFQPQGLLTVPLELPEKAYPKNDDVVRFWERLQARLAGAPGVRGVTVMSGLPPNRPIDANDIRFIGKVPSKEGPAWNVDYWQIVGDDYFRTMGIRLRAGRLFTPADNAEAQPVVLINEAMARRFWPGEDPLGKQVEAYYASNVIQTVVGVVADVKQQGVDAPVGTEIYFPFRQMVKFQPAAPRLMNIVLRAAADPRALLATARTEIAALDPSLPTGRVRTMDEILWEAVARPRFLTTLLTLFSGLALFLAAIGIYGVMTYSVAQRTQELGIRMALGAQPADVRRLVLSQGLRLAAAGVALGLLITVALGLLLRPLLSRLVYEVPLFEPFTLGGVALVVLATAALASHVPSARATRIDPMTCLRSE